MELNYKNHLIDYFGYLMTVSNRWCAKVIISLLTMKVETSPEPGNPMQREVIDFYGACDERPSSIVNPQRRVGRSGT